MKIFRILSTLNLSAACCAAVVLLSGCATGSKPAAVATPAAASTPVATVATPAPSRAPALPASETVPAKSEPTSPVASVAMTTAAAPVVALATIKGSQENSILFDNFTAFIAAVDGKKIEAGRKGWETPVNLEAGHRRVTVEFNRGVFLARAALEFEAVANAHYELKYITDAELFGLNSYCNFWIVDLGTGKTVCGPRKSSVEKLPEGAVTSAKP